MLIRVSNAYEPLVVGLTFVGYSVFSYEDEERKVLQWLNSTRQLLKSVDATLPTKLYNFIGSLLAALIPVLDRICGPRLFSPRALAASFLLGG